MAARLRSSKARKPRVLPRRCGTSLGPTIRTSSCQCRSPRPPLRASQTVVPARLVAPARLARLAVQVLQVSRAARCGPVASPNRAAPKAGDGLRIGAPIAAPIANREPPVVSRRTQPLRRTTIPAKVKARRRGQHDRRAPARLLAVLRRYAATVDALSAGRNVTAKLARAGSQPSHRDHLSRRSRYRPGRNVCKRCWPRPVSAAVAAAKS